MTDIPRKLSLDDMMGDPELYDIGRRVRVFLDGVEQRSCIEYDMDEGFIRRYALTDDGRLKHSGGVVELETVHGEVTVELKDE